MQRPTYARFFSISMAVMAAFGGVATVSTARAQADRTPGLSDQAPADKTPDISEQKLDAAVAAIKQIASVKADYEKKIEEARNPTASAWLTRPKARLSGR